MKNNIFAVLSLALVLGLGLSGCRNSNHSPDSANHTLESKNPSSTSSEQTETKLVVRFGDEGEPFILYLYDNDTASAIARYVGTSDWRLPIYHYDDFDNWEVMQYYDIPSRYEIPSDPKQVTEEKAGMVYYSEPNRIILFYQDAKLTAEYTPVGYFNYTDEFLQAVLNNPVLEGWGNKIIQINRGE